MAARTGRWVAVHSGVYRIEGARQTWEQRVLAACLATGGVASHRSAARLWGLDLPVSDRAEITVAASGCRSLRGARIHHTRELARTARDGIPCTSVARTLLDLAAVLEVDDLEAALHSAVRDGLTTYDHLERRLATKGRKGTAELRSLVKDLANQRPAESRRELDLARLLVRHGLPRPVRQHELKDGDGRVVARFDLAWPDARIAVEFDSYRHHSGWQAWRQDQARTNRATAHGWLVFTATEHDIADGCRALVADIVSAAAA